jgi:FkbM family methyltransferase
MTSLATRLAVRFHEIARAVPSPQGRRSLRRRYTFGALRSAVDVIGVDTDQGLVFVSTHDRTIGRFVYSDGAWDPRGLPNAIAVAEKHGFPGLTGRIFVEVGGNIGTTTLQAARLASRVLVFEPAPRNVSLLRANLAANNLYGQAEVVEAAVSVSNGTASLVLSDVNEGDHRVGEGGGLSITTVRLDDALAEREIASDDIGLLWLDTQGHEAQVLGGAPILLEAPPVTVTEYWPSELIRNGDLDAMDALILTHWETVIDLRSGDVVDDLSVLRSTYAATETDLLLLPRRRPSGSAS